MARQPRQTRIGFTGKFTPTGVDQTAGAKMRALAGLGQTIGDTAIAIGRPIIEAKAAKAGAQAVEEGAGKIDPQTGEVLEAPEATPGKFGASQYNQAAQQALAIKGQKASNAYLTSLNTEIRDTVENAAVEHAEDPVAFEAAIKLYQESTLATINDVEIKARVNDSIAGRALGHQLKIQEQYNIAEDKRNTDKHLAGLEGSAKSVLQMVDSGINEDAIALERQTAIDEMEAIKLIDPTYDVAGKTAVLDAAIYDQKTSTKIMNLATSLEAMPAAYAMLDKISRDVPSDRTPDEWGQFIDKKQEDLNTVRNRFINAKAVKTEAQVKLVEGVVARVNLGKKVSDEDLVAARAAAEGNPQLEKAFKKAQEVSIFSSSSYETRQNAINDACDGGAKTGATCQLLLSTDRAVQNAFAKDPMGLAIDQGYANPVPIDLLSPTEEQLEQRKTQANEASIHYSGRIGNVPILTDAEANALVAAVPELTVDEQVELFNQYGSDSYIYGLFSDKNAGVYAQAAGNPDSLVSRGIFKGKAIQVKGLFSFDDTSEPQNTFMEYVGQDTYDPDDIRDILDASIAHYVSTVGAEQKHTMDDSDFEDSIEAVTGGIDNLRGYNTVLPIDVSGDDLDSYFTNMSVEELARVVPGLSTDMVATVLPAMRDNMRIKKVKGENLYIAQYVLGDGSLGTLFQADNITPAYFTVTPEVINNAILENGSTRAQRAEAKYQLDVEKHALRVQEINEAGFEFPSVTQPGRMIRSGGEGPVIPEGFEPTKPAPEIINSSADQAMLRPDGSVKSEIGYLGPVTRDDGDTMTEFSIGVKINGVETLVPSMIPTLTDAEVEVLRTLPEGEKIPKAIQEKAADYAKKRMSEGKNPFFQDEEVEGKNADGTSFLYKG